MKKLIKFNQTHVKKNNDTCEVIEYLFNQPNIGIALATINGRYPAEQDKKVVNSACDLIYFVLEGRGTVHTKDGSFSLAKNDALFLACEEWYWVNGDNLEILVISAPEWSVDQYKEF